MIKFNDKEYIEVRWFDGMEIIKISDIPEPYKTEFKNWLFGQTLPLVTDDPEPNNWAYVNDFLRFISNKEIID